jgi:hypothetical protein
MRFWILIVHLNPIRRIKKVNNEFLCFRFTNQLFNLLFMKNTDKFGD